MRIPSQSPARAVRRVPRSPQGHSWARLRLEPLEHRSLPGGLSVATPLFSADLFGGLAIEGPGLGLVGDEAPRETDEDRESGLGPSAEEAPGSTGSHVSSAPQSGSTTGGRAAPAVGPAVSHPGVLNETSSLVFTAGLFSSSTALPAQATQPARASSLSDGGAAPMATSAPARPPAYPVQALGFAQGTAPPVAGASARPAADGLLIQFRAEATAHDREQVRALLGANLQEVIHTLPMQASGAGVLEQVQLPAGLTMSAAIARAAGHHSVVFAEPNAFLADQSLSNDAYYENGSLWGMYSDDSPITVGPAGTTSAYGSQAEEAWAAGNVGSRSVYVGVIDTGIQYTHKDLAANIWTSPFDPKDGIDNDGNGYVDDLNGWDFHNNDNSIFDPRDGDQHGTHVAGTIGAEGGNRIGVAGVNWEVTIIPAKILGRWGGTLASAIQAIDYFTDLKARHGLNIVALNNSYGGGGYSQAMHAAIIRAAKADILFVAAAGNDGRNTDASGVYPASYDTSKAAGSEPAASYDAVIAVTAIEASGGLASWANRGGTSVDLGAPGASVLSTLPMHKYGYYSGTSMAAPHVTGAAALYAASHPGATAAEIRDAIFSSAVPTESLAGVTVTGGRLNVSGF